MTMTYSGKHGISNDVVYAVCDCAFSPTVQCLHVCWQQTLAVETSKAEVLIHSVFQT